MSSGNHSLVIEELDGGRVANESSTKPTRTATSKRRPESPLKIFGATKIKVLPPSRQIAKSYLALRKKTTAEDVDNG
jgi:hypothetical protein